MKAIVQDSYGSADVFEAGTVAPIISHSYPLREVPTAVRALAEGHSRGKSVIKVC